jgi:hypothetical protein
MHQSSGAISYENGKAEHNGNLLKFDFFAKCITRPNAAYVGRALMVAGFAKKSAGGRKVHSGWNS